MKLTVCPKCGAPMLLDWTLDEYSLSDRLHCHACGFSDFVYVFLERGRRGCEVSARLGDDFVGDIRAIAADMRPDTALNALLSSLSARYRLSTFALVEIINSLLGARSAEPVPYNPLDYVAITEESVDAATLLRRIDEAAAEARAHVPAAGHAPATTADIDRWRLQYEQCSMLVEKLNDKYDNLRSAFEALKAENRRLKEYLGE